MTPPDPDRVVEFAGALLYPAGVREPRFALKRGRIVVLWNASALRTVARARAGRSLRPTSRGQSQQRREAMSRCWLFHDWTKWEVVEMMYQFLWETEWRKISQQRRTCRRCGLTDLRFL